MFRRIPQGFEKPIPEAVRSGGSPFVVQMLMPVHLPLNR
jgi:hypothetical protein